MKLICPGCNTILRPKSLVVINDVTRRTCSVCGGESHGCMFVTDKNLDAARVRVLRESEVKADDR